MAVGRLRAVFDVPVDAATTVFTDELDDLSSVRYTVEHEGNAARVNVGFVELATWVYPTIAALLGLVLAAFLVPDASLPTFLANLSPLWGFQRWWAVVFTGIVLVLCYLLSQVTALIPGGEINITPDGSTASNIEVRDVSEPYMYRALRAVVNRHDRHQAAARAEAQANQVTLGSVFGLGPLAGAGRGAERRAKASTAGDDSDSAPTALGSDETTSSAGADAPDESSGEAAPTTAPTGDEPPSTDGA